MHPPTCDQRNRPDPVTYHKVNEELLCIYIFMRKGDDGK